MKHPRLFEVPPTAPTKAAKLKAFKEQHGIWTHRAPMQREDHPWSAMLFTAAKERMGVQIKDPYEMIAGYCQLLDDIGLLVTGTSERDAIRRLCAVNDILFPL